MFDTDLYWLPWQTQSIVSFHGYDKIFAWDLYGCFNGSLIVNTHAELPQIFYLLLTNMGKLMLMDDDDVDHNIDDHNENNDSDNNNKNDDDNCYDANNSDDNEEYNDAVKFR